MIVIVMASLIILEGILGMYVGFQLGVSKTEIEKYRIDKQTELEKFRWITPVGNRDEKQ